MTNKKAGGLAEFDADAGSGWVYEGDFAVGHGDFGVVGGGG